MKTKINQRLAGCLVLLALSTLNPQLSTVFAQDLNYTNWDGLVTNWVQTSAPSQSWYSIASSADGTKWVAAACCGGGGIWVSTNSGASWTQTFTNDVMNVYGWSSVAASADGTKWVAAASGGSGGIYTSTNSGVTWTQTSAPGTSWYSVASSVDGTKWVAAVNGGGIWTAQATITSAPLLTAAKILEDGQFQFAFIMTNNVNYTVQYSTTLTNWTSLLTISGYGGPLTITDPSTTAPQRFYRVMIQ